MFLLCGSRWKKIDGSVKSDIVRKAEVCLGLERAPDDVRPSPRRR